MAKLNFFWVPVLILMVGLAGCQSKQEVMVSAMGPGPQSGGGTYAWGTPPGAPNDAGSLRFTELTRDLEPILQRYGWSADKGSGAEVDMRLELLFGVSDGRQVNRQVREPIFLRTGGGVERVAVPVARPDGTTGIEVATVYIPSRTVYAGSTVEQRQWTVYDNYIQLSAREVGGELVDGRPREIWTIWVSFASYEMDWEEARPILLEALRRALANPVEGRRVLQLNTN